MNKIIVPALVAMALACGAAAQAHQRNGEEARQQQARTVKAGPYRSVEASGQLKRGAKPVILLIASIGVTLMVQGLIRLFFGAGSYSFFETETKDIFRIDTSFLGSTRPLVITEPQLLMIIVTIISVLALDVTLKPDLAFNIIIPIFAAAIVGGLGQAYGAIAGGLLIGFAESLAVFNWTMVLRPLNAVLPEWLQLPPQLALVPTEYKLTVAFVILVVVLLVRPTGIFKGASS